MVAGINRQYLMRFPQIEVIGTFRDGKEARHFLMNNPVDLVVLDIYMPSLTGIELLKSLRSSGVKCDVIMVTAANDVAKVDEALKLGIVDYLIKPFEYARFKEAIEKYLNKVNFLSIGQTVSQDDIDRLVNISLQPEAPELRKGLQQRTLEHIRRYMQSAPCRAHTCETLSAGVGLSKVTVRRYLNYLIETGELTSTIDYETGGRPSVKYCLRSKR